VTSTRQQAPAWIVDEVNALARRSSRLMGVDVTADHDGGALGHPQIALPQLHPFALGQIGERLVR